MRILRLLIALSAASNLLLASASPLSSGRYTKSDDASWAVVSDHLSDPNAQAVYDEFMEGCRRAAGTEERGKTMCDDQEAFRMQMNLYQPQSVLNYTETGFLKIRAPEAVFSLIRDFWEAHKEDQTVEWETVNPYHNMWDSPPTILRVDNRTLSGGGPHLQAAIANAARDAMEVWTGLQQAPSSVYGIRVYHRGSILTPHVDRMPLISSAIINVDQDVDEPWVLEVYAHDGVAHNVTMEPGDLVLYESHSVIHGRPFPLKGKFYANIFVHFEPLNVPPSISTEPYDNVDFPPYLIPGSSWEPEWRTSFPNGWQLLNDAISLVDRDDLKTLQYMHKSHPDKLWEHDGTPAEWRPIHEAARKGFTGILKFLIEEVGQDVNSPCWVGNGMTPLALVHEYKGPDSDAAKYLESVGGVLEVIREEEELVDEL